MSLKRIIERLSPKAERQPDYEPERALEWLARLYENARHGFMHYYILRERQLKDEMAAGVEGSRYWTLYGRMEELKHLQSQAKAIYLTLEKKKGKK